MLSVPQARSHILEQCAPLPAQSIALTAALGRVLAESVQSDLDSPPFDKSLMDGFAVRSIDAATAGVTLSILETITAGRTPTRPLSANQASRIMTGAPLPEGCDAVVMIERARAKEHRVEVLTPPKPGDNILRRGREMKRGETILLPCVLLRPQEIGVLATIGRDTVAVVPAPRVAVLATGDELVEVAAIPGPGQIRNSNAPMLFAQAARAGGQPRLLGVARDSVESLGPLIEQGLRTSEILVLSGGVSAGQLDLVPDVLRACGVEGGFHKVAMKPGKPLFFGTTERPEGRRFVFGLPGNPVSSLVCFELFVRPAIRKLAGFDELDLPRVEASISQDFSYESDRTTYYPADLKVGHTGWQARPLPWFGSADLRAFLGANALLVIAAGGGGHKAGDMVSAMRLDG